MDCRRYDRARRSLSSATIHGRARVKRSMAVSLVLLGSTAFSLSACKRKAESYSNVEACAASGKHTARECEDAFAAAQREHQVSAPQYASRDECIAAAGPSGCEERHLSTGALVFLPMMLGFAMEPGGMFKPLYQYPRRPDCLYTRDGSQYGNCPNGGGGRGGSGGWFHGGGSSGGGSGGDDGTSARGGFGEAGHAASGGHGGGGGE